jgi:hypothetical protein
LQSLAHWHNTNVTAVSSNQTDFRDADALVYSKICSADKFLLFQNS